MNDSNEVTHKDLLRQPSTIALVGNPILVNQPFLML